jgi:tetratricopeptide (TPR) repeat protein
MDAALTYLELRQFPTALKLYDRALDITPNDPDVIAAKARIYQAQGNLQEAASLLSEITVPTYSEIRLAVKITQLRLERNYGEAIRFLEARLAQFHYGSELEQSWNQIMLASMQRLAGNTIGARVTAEHARNTLEALVRDQPSNHIFALNLSEAYAIMGERDLAIMLAERAVMLGRAVDHLVGLGCEKNLAEIRTMFGDNSLAISTLTQLLQTPYFTANGAPPPLTPALLRLDPIWDPLRADPAFQKLCEEKQH